MNDKLTYRVVFYGRLVRGYESEQVVENMARIFKQDLKDTKTAAKINRMFSGQPFVIKSQLAEDEAVKYRDAICNMGAQCHVELDTNTGSHKPHFIERRKLDRRKRGDRRNLQRGSSILPDRRSGFGRRKADPHPDD